MAPKKKKEDKQPNNSAANKSQKSKRTEKESLIQVQEEPLWINHHAKKYRRLEDSLSARILPPPLNASRSVELISGHVPDPKISANEELKSINDKILKEKNLQDTKKR